MRMISESESSLMKRRERDEVKGFACKLENKFYSSQRTTREVELHFDTLGKKIQRRECKLEKLLFFPPLCIHIFDQRKII